MRASLDTNAVIHFYRANLQDILFHFFDEGVFIYEQIRDIELENHGKDILEQVDADIEAGKIEKYTTERLKELSVVKIKQSNAPIGVATYQLSSSLSENMKEMLPEPEEIVKRLRIFEKS